MALMTLEGCGLLERLHNATHRFRWSNLSHVEKRYITHVISQPNDLRPSQSSVIRTRHRCADSKSASTVIRNSTEYSVTQDSQPPSLSVFTSSLCCTLNLSRVNTIFINKHCCSSVLMLRLHRLEQSSLIRTHC